MRWLHVVSVFCVCLVLACGDDDGTDPMEDAGPGTDTGVERCGGGDDPDGDFISSMDEGTADTDGEVSRTYFIADGEPYPRRRFAALLGEAVGKTPRVLPVPTALGNV